MSADPWTGPPLIGLAHGSRDPRAAAAIHDLMAAVGALRPGLEVASAFLDLSQPDLRTAVAAIGAHRAVVVPLLFAQAFHARSMCRRPLPPPRRSAGRNW